MRGITLVELEQQLHRRPRRKIPVLAISPKPSLVEIRKMLGAAVIMTDG